MFLEMTARLGGVPDGYRKHFGTAVHSPCVLTRVAYMKLSNPCCWSFFFPIRGCVCTALPPKCGARNHMRDTDNSFILSSMVTGKISNPTLESLVKTDTSSSDFLSGFIFVCEKYRGS